MEPGITNMPGTWDHVAPNPWVGQRNEMWVSSTAVSEVWETSLESAVRTGSDPQVCDLLVRCFFPRPKAQVGSRGSERGLWVHGSQKVRRVGQQAIP